MVTKRDREGEVITKARTLVTIAMAMTATTVILTAAMIATAKTATMPMAMMAVATTVSDKEKQQRLYRNRVLGV